MSMLDEENGSLSTGGAILLLEANPWLLVSLAFIMAMAEGLGGSAVLNPAG
jgi:hypothetical protein